MASIAVVVFLAAVLAWPMGPLFDVPRSTVLLDRHGELLGACVADDGQWRFPASDTVPDRFATCLIQFEDRHFHEHWGVHLPSLVRALKQNLGEADRVSGGSTLTMQVARLSHGGADRTYWQKLKEIAMAYRLEARRTKAEILSLFCANAPFGGNVVGLDAAAWRYYGRPAARLSWAECATLAVLPNAPSVIYPGKGHTALRAKRDRLLDRLLAHGDIDSLEWSLAKEEVLPEKAHALPQLAPHLFATLRMSGHQGRLIQSTIDAAVQARTTAIVAGYRDVLAANEVHNAAALVLDLATGEVLAYIGNMPGAATEHAAAVDIARAMRSTGSLLKPFLYADMLRTGELMPDMLVADVPSRYDGFDPRNYDMRYNGAVPASEALSRSLNVPAVRSLRRHGIEPTLRTIRAMGVDGVDRSAGHYGLSLIVGGAESDLWSITGAYASMGRILLFAGSQSAGPVVHPPVVVRGEGVSERGSTAQNSGPPLPASAIHFTLEALRGVKRPENEANWAVFGDAQHIAWKTGTSMGHRDAWAVGLNHRVAIGVWTGNASGEGRPGLTGTLAAAPILFELFRSQPDGGGFELPYDQLVRLPVCRKSGHRSNGECPVDTLWMPHEALRSIPCPYHQRVRVDPSGRYRVPNSAAGREAVYFTLPPAMEAYYAPDDPTYQRLPPWADADLAAGADQPMESIYPEHGTRVLLPVDLNGDRGKVVFEAAHRDPSTAVHWHLDGGFIGTTTGDHHMVCGPAPGAHQLLLTDANGHRITISFTVLAGTR